ncbi:MAG: biopolymer transporter ExbD [Betaproteobacteria bacterium RIFCSPLOWO2_12_FULL_65_14]|nr:MAG: biopolymer transporter ExbD [Betaproteobacteria bacterium RIFCSPLOWO2_12_FULL_65_14]
MAFGSFDKGGATAPMAEINMIPLIDVMLVLLVIFIITAPLLTHAVKVDLPKASSTPNITKPENVQLAIDDRGIVYWNGEVLDRSGWRSRMDAAAAQSPPPEVHIRADGAVAYRRVAEVMADAAKAGLTRVGFVTDPRDKP